MTVILYIGGARSGKSALAEGRVRAASDAPYYIATAQAGDDEMAARIARHRADRGQGWRVIEEPLDLIGALAACEGGVCLVDCLTLWLSNVMLAERDVAGETDRLLAALAASAGTVVLVTNEVGQGIVPQNALARAFRDSAGRLNQGVAALADEVVLVTAGLAQVLKG
ncbi:MAG: bifunctional adenosylcobinamide kinase/adenosylcobinamide-phosphate guanylyltransferase [Pseudomonadota bacterium]